MLKLKKIISGGQVGADQGGLFAARALGLATGGWAPLGWWTLAGGAPWLAGYGLVEHASGLYPPRTRANVKDSDATVRFAHDFGTAGELCTLRALERARKPYLDIDIAHPIPHKDFVRWLEESEVVVLNVAGNAKAPLADGLLASSVMESFTKSYLIAALQGVL